MFQRSHLLIPFLFTELFFISVLAPTSSSQSTLRSLAVNGSTAYADIANSSSINITGPITVEAWIRVNTIDGNFHDIVSRIDRNTPGSGGGYALAVNNLGKVRMDLFQAHNQSTNVVGATVLSANTWYHVAGVFSGTQMRVYVNGVLDGSLNTTNAPVAGNSLLRIGRAAHASGPPLFLPSYAFAGLIDEVRVSAAALYTGNFTAGLGPGSNVRGLWKFDGQTANDFSGNGNHGTLTGGATYSIDVPPSTNTAPTVALVHPLNTTAFSAGSTIVIDAIATDSDGSVSKVDFYQGTTLLGTDTNSPYSFVWTNVPVGSYSLTAKATDDANASTASTAIDVSVLPAGGQHSLALNGTTAYADVANSTSINITGPITVEAWIKVNTIDGNFHDIVSRIDRNTAGSGGGYALAVNNVGKVRMDLFQAHNQSTNVVGATVLSANTWYHVAGVFSGTQLRVYVNGVLDGSLNTTNAPVAGNSLLRIGRAAHASGPPLYLPSYAFAGLIDEVRVSAAALYTSNFTAGLGTGSNVRGLWKFDGQTPNDFSGNGNHGTLQGGATYAVDVPPSAGGGSQVPVAFAGGPYSAQLAQSVQFSSSGSFDPDGSIASFHWNFGDGSSANSANPGHAYSSPGLYTATLTVTDNSGLRASTTAAVTISSTSNARLDPLNQTGSVGENPLSRNFNWSLSLLNLPGRAGMDLGLALSYNSLVWTKSGNNISFDDDRGFPAPGFRLGFPVIQPSYFNAEVGKHAFLLISPDGSRTELRQVGSSSLFEAADSSYLLLDASTMVLRASDGTQFSYVLMGNEFNCTQIKDSNGNYLTINYTSFGRIDSVIDTLGRSIKFNYDAQGLLISITQIWNHGSPNQVTHNWARFEYSNTIIATNFTGLSVSGPSNNSTIKTLARVRLADDSHYDFSYTSWGQMWKVSSFAADNHMLNHRHYNLPQTAETAQTDCPRFTERRDWAQYWNGDTEGIPASSEEAVTTFAVPVSDTWTMPDGTQQSGTRAQVTTPDGTSNRIYFLGTAGTSSGWRRGLPALVNTYDSGGTLQRQIMTTWTQDNTSISYQLNPRIKETNTYDPAGNRARTEITYQQHTFANGTSCQLPRDLYEYAANATTKLRSTRTEYNNSGTYTDRRVIGLVSEKRLYEGDVNNGGVLMAKVAFNYDESGSIQGTDAPVQHDNANYSASLLAGRGNLSSVKRYDVTNTSVFTTTRTRYNTAGAVVSSKDALNHEVLISYADSFSDSNNSRNTLAYATTVTDADGYTSTSKYHFDFGAVTFTRTPQPNVTTNTPGPEQITEFDTVGRVQKVTNVITGAYTEFEYSPSQIRIDTYSTIQEGQGEAHSFRITDGAGRLIATASELPGTIGGYSGRKTVYDVMGRVIKTSNPTETDADGGPAQWNAAGDDASAGWVYIQQTYDWKGRPLITTNQDGTTKSASYAGCGCAGGEVTTFTDEGTIDSGIAKRRQWKVYTDVLGRTIRTELLSWEGGTVYSATVNTYDARDQITDVKQYAGPESGGNPHQQTMITYDGFGRLKTRHLPQDAVGKVTTWTYNADDTVNTITDPRDAVSAFSYAGTNRKLVKTITHTLSGKPTLNVAFNYDAVGNRISMTDSLGTSTYNYSSLSQLTSESRTLGGTTYTLSYQYNLAGQLKKMTYPGNMSINYDYDKIGRVNAVTGSDTLHQGVTQYASGFSYRASGVRKAMTDGSNRTNTITYDSRLRPLNYQISGGVVNQTYQYYNDGRIRFVSNATDSNFDRSFHYDHAARLTFATTGGSARGDSGAVPYFETFAFDVWGDITSRVTETWSQDVFADNGTYTNRRRDGWEYEADGQIKTIESRNYSYDAAGNNVLMSGQLWSGSAYFPTSTSSGFDGDGKKIEDVSGWPTALTSRYLRSSVLRGKIVQEINSAGQTISYVFLPDGTPLSTLGGMPKWKHETPGGTGRYETFQSGFVNRVEFDPFRANVGLTAPAPRDTNGGDGDLGFNHTGGPSDSRFSNLANLAAGCFSVNGVDLPCTTWSSLDVLEFFVWSPSRNSSVSAPMENLAVWVPPKRVVPINIPNPFDKYLDIPVARVDTTYTPGYWRVAAAPFLQIKAGQKARSTDISDEMRRGVEEALRDCIPKFYPQYSLVSFQPTTNTSDGVIRIRDLHGTEANMVNDSSPPADVIRRLANHNARGEVNSTNPWWTYSIGSVNAPDLRKGEMRYPQLYLAPGMDFVRTQIHETGAALTHLRDRYYPGPYARPSDDGLDPDHKDDGPAMEDCVGKHYYAQRNLQRVN